MSSDSRIPIPFCGVALAVAALGLVLEQWSLWAWAFCGVLSSVMVCFFIARVVLFPHAVVTDLSNPVLAGVAGTLPMATLNLSTYLAHLSWHAGFALWLASVVLFVAKHVRNAHIDDLTPAYFVVFVGTMAASTTAPSFDMQLAGLALSLVGMAVTVALVFLVTVHIARSPLPEPLRPMMYIYAAPPSMCLAAYLSCAAEPSGVLAIVLYVLSCAFYLVGLTALIGYLRLPFYPTYAAMTFPLVIATAASFKFAAFLQGSAFVEAIGIAQTIIACLAVSYVFVRYMQFLLGPR